MKNIKTAPALILATGCLFSIASVSSIHAATQGDLAIGSSEGTVEVTGRTQRDPASAQVRISGLTDIDLGEFWFPEAGGITDESGGEIVGTAHDICVYTDFGASLSYYDIDISSANGGVGYGLLKNSADLTASGIRYVPEFRDLEYESGTVGHVLRTDSENCSNSSTEDLPWLELRNFTLFGSGSVAYDADYTDTLTLTVTPF